MVDRILQQTGQGKTLPAADLNSFTEQLPEPKQYEVIPGADHFWWGYEDKVAPRVAAFFAETLKQSAQA